MVENITTAIVEGRWACQMESPTPLTAAAFQVIGGDNKKEAIDPHHSTVFHIAGSSAASRMSLSCLVLLINSIKDAVT